jgi:hypothetical protein
MEIRAHRYRRDPTFISSVRNSCTHCIAACILETPISRSLTETALTCKNIIVLLCASFGAIFKCFNADILPESFPAVLLLAVLVLELGIMSIFSTTGRCPCEWGLELEFG